MDAWRGSKTLSEELCLFDRDPFVLEPDPPAFFQSVTHREGLPVLEMALAQGEGFVLILGEAGVGKSAILAHLLGKLPERRVTFGHVSSPRPGILARAADSFELEIAGARSAVAAIQAFLHDAARAGRRCLLAIDEAQDLSVDDLKDLREISEISLGKRTLLQIVLLGPVELLETIQERCELQQVRRRVIAAHEQLPLSRAEIALYVASRLRSAGQDAGARFTPDFCDKLFHASGGNLRRVNAIISSLATTDGYF